MASGARSLRQRSIIVSSPPRERPTPYEECKPGERTEREIDFNDTKDQSGPPSQA